MSDYNRFVSYIYLYENGVKTMNAGFVKVESRNGQCRVGLSLKNVYTGLERCQIYMFLRVGQELRGVRVGEVPIKNHGGEWYMKTRTENISDSGYRLNQMSGMIIRGDEDKFYGTLWDQDGLDIRNFRTHWDSEEETAASDGEEVEEETGMAGHPEADPPVTTELLRAEAMPELETAAETEAEEEGEAEEENERRRNFRKILDQCPGMYPFEDDAVDMCVRLEPQDIGRMPIDCWGYGNNSFLLHGYYSYRHLILARLRREEDSESGYILGVPGTRHSREAFMANMFGFRSFKPIRERDEGESDFGYWYTFLA